MRSPRGGELLEVDAAGNHRCPGLRHAYSGQFENLVGAGGDDAIGAFGDRLLEAYAVGRAGVVGSLVAAFHHPQRVEGLDDRDACGPSGLEGGQAGHPEVRVHHIGAAVSPLLLQESAEFAYMGQQFVLRQRVGRPGRDMDHAIALCGGDSMRSLRVVAPRVDGDVVPLAAQSRGQLRDMDVLPPGIDAAQHG